MKTKNFTSYFYHRFFVIIIMSIFFSTSEVSAETNSWVGPTSGGDWSTASNWSSNAVPVATDSVLIASPNAVTISSTVGTINKMLVQGSLTITTSGSLTISQTVKSTSLLEIGGGVVNNAGSLTLIQTLANNVPGLSFVNGTAADGTLTNSGNLSINTSAGSGDCVRFNQTSGGKAVFNMGNGEVTLNTASTKNIFNINAGNAEIGGKLTLGNITTYPNYRLLNIANGNLTLLSSANITAYVTITTHNIYLGASAGTINTKTASTLTNYGSLTIHGSNSNTNNGILLTPSQHSSSTLINNGIITIDGTFSASSTGCFNLTGNTDGTTISTLDNAGTISVNNTGTAAAIFCSTTAGRIIAIKNSGQMTFRTGANSDVTLGVNTTFDNNNGGIVKIRNRFSGTAVGQSLINNNIGGIINFDVPNTTSIATNSLTFKNHGTITGRGIFNTGTFFPQSGGTISPGNTSNSIDKFTIYSSNLDFTGTTFMMDVNGKTAAGTDFDQVSTTATGIVTMSPTSTVFNVNVGGAYTPVNGDVVTLFSCTGVGGTISSAPVSDTMNWLTTLNSSTNQVFATFSFTTGSETIETKHSINSANGKITVTTIENQLIEIFNTLGQRLVSKISVNGLNSIEIPDRGLVIVRVGGKSQKIML